MLKEKADMQAMSEGRMLDISRHDQSALTYSQTKDLPV
jgi:hypothetical protein